MEYRGNTNLKSAFTKHLFSDFRKAYFHFKPRLEARRQFEYHFYAAIESSFPYICYGEGMPHINNADVKMLYGRCEELLLAVQSMELDDADNIMAGLVVATGNYLAMVLDFTAHDARLRRVEGVVNT